ncbi:MAG: DUF58 domain-containing protein [Myxococcota bacterium]
MIHERRAEGSAALAAEANLDARALRLRARRDVSTALAGAYRSAFRGRGLAFEELREYQPGDDMRTIEWNATARLGRPISKRMREERDLVVALLVDLSPSVDFGSGGSTKRGAIVRAAAALAAAALGAGDRVALATFARDLVGSLSPSSAPHQLERVVRALSACPRAARTDTRAALAWAVNRLPRHAVAILISDGLFPDPGATLRRCARKHELCLLRVEDPADRLPARIAPIRGRGAESGRPLTLRRRRGGVATPIDLRLLRRLGIEVGILGTGRRLLPSLQRFFEHRDAPR